MKRSAILLVALASACAHGSFELVLGADFLHGRIQRWDGDTGRQFGTFGEGHLSTFSISGLGVNVTLGHCYVYDRASRNVFTFNYNTGAYIGNFATTANFYTWLTVAPSGEILLFGSDGAGSTKMLRYSPNGTLIKSYEAYTGQSSYSGVQSSDGNFYTVDAVGGFALQYLPNAVGWTSFNGSDPFFKMGSGQMAVRNGIVYAAASQFRSVRSFVGAAGMAIGTEISFTSNFDTEVTGVGFGHGNNMYVGGYNSGTSEGRVVRYNLVSGKRTLLDPVPGGNIAGIAVIAAPEPGSLVAMAAAGGLLILRRRRK